MHKSYIACAATLVVLLIAGCGDNEPASPAAKGTGAGDKSTKITLGVMPLTDVAPAYLGQSRGTFADQGLELEMQVGQTSSAVTAAVMSGEAQIGYTGTTTAIQAAAQGLPIKVIASAAAAVGGTTGIITKKDSPIRHVKDLNGKTIAVSGLKAQTDLFTRAAAAKLGADPESFKTIPLPFPDMHGTLDADRVDAIYLVNPFYSELKNEGYRVVIENPGLQVLPEAYTQGVWFTTEKYLAENEDVVRRFVNAIEESNAYALEHRDRVATTVLEFTKLTPEQAKTLPPPIFAPELHALQETADLLLEFEFIEERVETSELTADF